MLFQIAMSSVPRERTIDEWLDHIFGCGIRCAELSVRLLPAEAELRDEIILRAKERGLALSLHAPFGKTVNIIDTDEAIRVESVRQIKDAIDLAAKHQLSSVTFHPGHLSSEDEDTDSKWEQLIFAVGDIAAYAKEKKVRVGLENMERRMFELVCTVDDLNRFAELGRDNPYFGITMDFAHYATHCDRVPDLSALKLPLYNVHISQGIGGIMHYPLTVDDGMVDIRGICRALDDYGYRGFVVMELREPLYTESRQILEAAAAEI